MLLLFLPCIYIQDMIWGCRLVPYLRSQGDIPGIHKISWGVRAEDQTKRLQVPISSFRA